MARYLIIITLLSLLCMTTPALHVCTASPFSASIVFTPAEQKWLKEHPVIRLAPDPDFKPIEYFDKNGTYQGAAADIIGILEKKLGITITKVRLKNWDEAMERFKNHEVDLLGAMVRTPNREKFALFTDTLVAVPGGIFARRGALTNLTLNDLKGKRVAVVSNYAAHDILNNLFPEIHLEVVPDVSTGLAKASLGIVDAYVENMANATFYAQEAGITNLQLVGRTDFDYRWGIGIRQDWPELQGILNKGLAAISQEERDHALQKWIFVEGQHWLPSKTFIIGSVATLLGLLLALTLYLNYALKKIVRQRTASLREELEERQKAENALKTLTEQLEERVRERTVDLEKEITERLKSEQAVDDSEKRFRSIFENSPIAISISDTGSGQLVEVNNAWLILFSYERTEVIGRTTDELGLYVNDDKRDEIVRVVRESGRIVNQAVQLRRKSGKIIDLLYCAETITLGSRSCLQVMMTDITDRKRSEEALQLSEERYRRFTALTTDFIHMCNRSGTDSYRVKWMAGAVEAITGYSQDEIVAQGCWLPLVVPEDRERVDESLRRLNPGDIARHEFRIKTKEGNIRWLHEVCCCEAGEAPGQLILYGTSQDITERKSIEGLLQESQDLFSLFMKYAPIYTFIKTIEGDESRIVQLSDNFIDIVGRPAEELRGRTVAEVFPEDFARKIMEEDMAVANQGKIVHLEEEFNGRRYMTIKFPIIREGENLFIAVFTIDVTDRVRAEEERMDLERKLLHAQKLESLGILAGGIAHDFNNLLAAILGNLDLALLRLPLGSSVSSHIEQSMQACRRAADLTRQMLAYAGKGMFQFKSIDLNDVIIGNAEFFRTVIPRNITLTVNTANDLPQTIADSGQIQQVVMNLITNAAEAIGTQAGVISIATGSADCSAADIQKSVIAEKPAPGKFVYIEVADNGSGMNEETKYRLFDPFFTTKFTGRGLGMSASQGIVRAHNGMIILESEEGKGTIFRIFFPAAAAATQGQQQDSPQAEKKRPPADRKGKILIVDDEEIIRALGVDYAKYLGFESLEACNGAEALDIFRHHADDIAVVVLDMTMPVLDGITTFYELKRIKPDVRVILSSGYSEQSVSENFPNEKPDAFMEKPFQAKEFNQKIDQVLQ